MKLHVLALFLLLCFSSCASLLNGKYQQVTITTQNTSDKILIDGETPKMKKGKYLVERDLTPKQITVTSEGYKDEHLVLMQYKKSPLLILSWIPFIVVYGPYFDRGPKSWNYDPEINITNHHKVIKKREEADKEVQINNVSVALEEGDIGYRYFYSYRNFLNQEARKSVETSDEDKAVNIENTVFSYALNDILAQKGYIDTTKKALKNSYANNLYLNATITNYTLHHVKNTAGLSGGRGGMLFLNLSIRWEVLDYYKMPILKDSTLTTSGQFAFSGLDYIDDAAADAIADAMEIGLTEIMDSEKLKKALSDKSDIQKEQTQATITIPKATTYLSNLGQAIEASLTIKTDKGFGSGFLISNDGYIITNYHVIADTTGLNVILNDETKHAATIVRVSKIHDLALLKIDVKGKVPFQISDSKKIEIAQEIYAVGTPTAEDLSQTISRGIISGVRKGDNGSKLIQTDASGNGGNSGGPLVTKEGLVLGVVSSKVRGFGIEGVAFVIPAYEILDQLKIELK